MSYSQYNPNPVPHNRVGDCVIRAISKALNQSWEETYMGICLKGLDMGDMPSGNHVWGEYLKEHGYTRHAIPAEHNGVYTVENFANDHHKGTFILAIEGHVVCVQDGVIFDSWNSSNELPVYYWARSN